MIAPVKNICRMFLQGPDLLLDRGDSVYHFRFLADQPVLEVHQLLLIHIGFNIETGFNVGTGCFHGFPPDKSVMRRRCVTALSVIAGSIPHFY
jgi:hypothetical protein